jgi:hypothetical protein
MSDHVINCVEAIALKELKLAPLDLISNDAPEQFVFQRCDHNIITVADLCSHLGHPLDAPHTNEGVYIDNNSLDCDGSDSAYSYSSNSSEYMSNDDDPYTSSNDDNSISSANGSGHLDDIATTLTPEEYVVSADKQPAPTINDCTTLNQESQDQGAQDQGAPNTPT